MIEAIMLSVIAVCWVAVAYFLTIAGIYTRSTSHWLKCIDLISAGQDDSAEKARAEQLAARADRMAFWSRS